MSARNSSPLGRRRLNDCAGEARQWLFEHAAPLWADARRRPGGLFAEALDHDAEPLALPRRLRVQARQIYSYCALGKLGWNGDWRGCAGKALDILIDRGRRSDGFFIHTFSPDGAPLDLRADLYDHAFILLCLAHAAEGLERPELLDIASDTMDLIERHWRHFKGGFTEGEIDGPPRRQNPHMHMLEAAKAQWSVSRAPRWKALTQEIADLCARRFVDPATGALTEYFAADWQRLPGEEGQIVEPGHCLEWAWLFETLEGGEARNRALADGLTAYARAHGLDSERGVAINEVRLDGSLKNGQARLWPQTERMKAALVRYRRIGQASEADEAVAAFNGLRKYWMDGIAGLWYDHLEQSGAWVTQPVPASSFYHIVCGISELLETAAL